MNVETSNIKKAQDVQSQNTKPVNNAEENTSVKFADELKDVAKNKGENIKELEVENKVEKKVDSPEDIDLKLQMEKGKTLNFALKDMNAVLKEFSQTEDKKAELIKKSDDLADRDSMINNDFNIQENKDLMPQMNPNMNFSGDGQPFSSFMNNEENSNKHSSRLDSTVQDLAEEAAILSTMAENIAMANRNQLLSETKIVTNGEGVKKIDSRTNIKIEEFVKYDSIIMNQADVEVFVNLVEKGEVDIKELTPKMTEKSVQVSKTLADMLAKSMENNQPIRINFDNNISVIIRISRDGKITADFLPSSQVAEAYLKENLPLLRQKFDDNNIEYESLNQRERREQNKDNNKKKGRNNE